MGRLRLLRPETHAAAGHGAEKALALIRIFVVSDMATQALVGGVRSLTVAQLALERKVLVVVQETTHGHTASLRTTPLLAAVLGRGLPVVI